MQQQHGRKALAVLTDAEDRGSMATPARAIAAGTVLYAIHFKSEQGVRRPSWRRLWRSRRFPGGGFPGGGKRGGVNHPDGNSAKTDHWRNWRWRVRSRRQADLYHNLYADRRRALITVPLWIYARRRYAGRGVHRVELTMPKDEKLIVQT